MRSRNGCGGQISSQKEGRECVTLGMAVKVWKGGFCMWKIKQNGNRGQSKCIFRNLFHIVCSSNTPSVYTTVCDVKWHNNDCTNREKWGMLISWEEKQRRGRTSPKASCMMPFLTSAWDQVFVNITGLWGFWSFCQRRKNNRKRKQSGTLVKFLFGRYTSFASKSHCLCRD